MGARGWGIIAGSVLGICFLPCAAGGVAFAWVQPNPPLFSVPAPTRNAQADLAAITTTLQDARAWQASQPEGKDGLPSEVTVQLAPGAYSICPPTVTIISGQFCIHLADWTNLHFEGTGNRTEILDEDPDSGFIQALHSQHITISDLTFDYRTPPFTQGVIVGVNKAANGRTLSSLDVRIDPGYQTFADPLYQFHNPSNDLIVMDPHFARVKRNVPNFMRTSYDPAPYLLPDRRTWRITFSQPGSPNWSFSDSHQPLIVPGDRFVYDVRLENHGIFFHFCDTVALSHITLYSAAGLATGYSEVTGHITVDHLKIEIRPGSGRLISTNADGAHFQNDRAQITLRNSSFQGMADDAVAIYSVAFNAQRVLSTGSGGQFITKSPREIMVGDKLQILDPATGSLRGSGNVTAVSPSTCSTLNGVTCTVTLDNLPAGTAPNDILYLLSAAGNGVRIFHNTFFAHRGHGIILNSPNSVIQDNTFADLNSGGIMVGPFHAAFDQGPIPDHVLIENNLFTGGDVQGGQVIDGQFCAPSSISGCVLPVPTNIYDPQIMVTSVVPSTAHPPQITTPQGPSDLTIVGNRFYNPSSPSVEVGVGSRIALFNNSVTSSNAVVRVAGPSVLFSAGSDFSVENLVVFHPGPYTSAAVEIGCGVSPIPNYGSWRIYSVPIPRVIRDTCP